MLTGRKLGPIADLASLLSAERTTCGDRNGRSRRGGMLGFTMLEMMVVIAIIMILLGLAAGRYQRSLLRSREAVLHQDLRVMRDAIQQYTMDKEAPPSSLDDLKTAGYLREIPMDPITQQTQWDTVPDDGTLLTPEQTTTSGIMDVHSKSNEISPFENTPYNTW